MGFPPEPIAPMLGNHSDGIYGRDHPPSKICSSELLVADGGQPETQN
jgi:hypothetical protein